MRENGEEPAYCCPPTCASFPPLFPCGFCVVCLLSNKIFPTPFSSVGGVLLCVRGFLCSVGLFWGDFFMGWDGWEGG